MTSKCLSVSTAGAGARSQTEHHDRKLLRQRAIGVDKAAGNRPKANTTAERPSEFVTHCLRVGIPRFVK
jgi:hypothetical protein